MTGVIANVTAVAIGGRGLLIEGPPGAGKSSLALMLIDRGAVLIGDDAIAWRREGDRLVAAPPPHISGRIEMRGVGLLTLPTTVAPVALVLHLVSEAPRLPEAADRCDRGGVMVPALPFVPGDAGQALRAEWALACHGLTFGNGV